MPTIIDALLVTLGLDDTGMKQGRRDAEHELEAIGDKAEDTGRRIQEGMEGGAEGFKTLLEGAMGLLAFFVGAKEFGEFGHAFLENEDAVGKFSRMLDLNIEELQGWQRAIALEGGTAEGFRSILEHLTSTLALIEIHGPRSKMALKLFEGIGIKEADLKGLDSFQTMLLISEKIQGMDKGLSVGLLKRMGFDESSILLMQKGPAAIRALVDEQKNLGTFTEKDAEAAEKFNDTMLTTQTQFKIIFGQIVNAVLPALQWMADGLGRVAAWAKDNPGIVRAGIIGIAAAFGVLAAALIPVVVELIPIELGLLLVAAAVGVIVAGIVHLKSEWDAWAAGADSRFAPLFRSIHGFWERWGPLIQQVGGILKEFVLDRFAELADQVGLVMAILSGDTTAIGKAFDVLGKDAEKFGHLMTNVLAFAAAAGLNILRRLWNAAWQGMADFALQKLDSVKSALGGGLIARVVGATQINPAKQAVNFLASQQQVGSIAGAFGPAPVMHHSERSVHIDKVEVQTQATDAKGIAKDLPKAWDRNTLITAAEGAF